MYMANVSLACEKLTTIYTTTKLTSGITCTPTTVLQQDSQNNNIYKDVLLSAKGTLTIQHMNECTKYVTFLNNTIVLAFVQTTEIGYNSGTCTSILELHHRVGTYYM